MSKKTIIRINIILFFAMLIHVGIKMYIHSNHSEYSSPVYVELVISIYYIIALFVVNFLNFLLKYIKNK